MIFDADRGLDHDLEHLPGDDFFHLRREQPSLDRRLLPVDDQGEGVHRLAVDQDVELDRGLPRGSRRTRSRTRRTRCEMDFSLS